MKNFILILLVFCSLITTAQIFTQNPVDGSITITPKGLQGSNSAGISNTNVSLGGSALFSNNGGNSNTAIGNNALYSNTTGHVNTANGFASLYKNTSGIGNTALGGETLKFNTTGDYNTATGVQALHYNTTGNFNSATGVYSLFLNSTGYSNTAIGYAALYLNMSGNCNSAIGQNALGQNINGSYNTASGVSASNKNTTGNYNIATGYQALLNNTTGSGNVGIGYNSGNAISTGALNTFLGYNANASTDITNAMAIGANTIVDANNKVRIGDTGITVIEGQVPWSNPSDRRLKENITYTNRLGLDFICRLQTVSYNYKADKNKTRHDGFIAQDIEQVMKDLDLPFSGLKKSDSGIYSLAYSDFVIPLVNAVKELKNQNEALIAELNDLKKAVSTIKAELVSTNSSK